MTQADEPQLACPNPCTTECISVTTDRFGNVVRQAGVESDWKLWEVWVEGHQYEDGRRTPASYIRSVFGKTFNDAVRSIFNHWDISYTGEGTPVWTWDEHRRIFDNETDAKRLYGC